MIKPSSQQIIFFAHGSSDPIWQAAVNKLSKELETSSGCPVSVAFMERATPDLETVVEKLTSAGATSFLIVPLFLAPGGHMSHDVIPLVERLKRRYPAASFTLQSTLLENQAVCRALIDDIKGVLNRS